MTKREVKRWRKTWWTALKSNGKPTIKTPDRLGFTLRTNWRLYLCIPGWYNVAFDYARDRNDWMYQRRVRLRRIIELCYKHGLDEKAQHYTLIANDHSYYTL